MPDLRVATAQLSMKTSISLAMLGELPKIEAALLDTNDSRPRASVVKKKRRLNIDVNVVKKNQEDANRSLP